MNISATPSSNSTAARALAVRFVILLGFVSLFADMTYEGARSAYGPFLGNLGASAFVISIVAGVGELLGYGLRLLSGRFTDKTGRYWPITIVGYLVNLLSVPALALVGSWQAASGLVIAGRAGRARLTPPRARRVSRGFWVYAAGAGLIALGYADFPLIAFHFARRATFTSAAIPLTYALGMGAAAVSALLFGKLFDRLGLASTAFGVLAAAAFAPLAFFWTSVPAIAGVALWGVGLGIQESAMRARLAELAPHQRRASAYGLFDLIFGICWFAGSAVMGILYTRSINVLVIFSVAAQVAAIPLLLMKLRTPA